METYLVHHGIYGQKWGIRRYQNPDGSLTEAGKKRYRLNSDESAGEYTNRKKLARDIQKAVNWKEREYGARREDYIRNDYKSRKLAEKGKAEKAKKYAEKAKISEQKMKDAEADTWRLLGRVGEYGLQAIGEQTGRMSDNQIVAYRLLGIVGELAYNAISAKTNKSQKEIYGDSQDTIQINKWKVRA